MTHPLEGQLVRARRAGWTAAHEGLPPEDADGFGGPDVDPPDFDENDTEFVTGELTTREIDLGVTTYTKHTVGNVDVDPESIEAIQ